MIEVPFHELPASYFAPGFCKEFFSYESCIIFEDESDFLSPRLSVNLYSPSSPSAPQNGKIFIGKIAGGLSIKALINNTSIQFGSNCAGYWDLACWSHSQIYIGDGTTANGVRIEVDRFGVVTVGKDSMFSDGVLLQCGDMHPIYCLKEGKQLNSLHSRISIGDHCWLGRNSTVIASSRECGLGDGSILGISSVLTRMSDSYCLIAGNPARTLRSNISWGRGSTADRYDPEDIFKLSTEHKEHNQ